MTVYNVWMNEQIYYRIKHLIESANEMLNLQCPMPLLSYMNSEHNAAVAYYDKGEYFLRINRLLERDSDFMNFEVLPHEVAHLMMFHIEETQGYSPDGKYHHGQTWQRIAQMLGCSGKAILDSPIGFNLNRYLYRMSNDECLYVSKRYHNEMQQNHRVLTLTPHPPYVTITASGFIRKD